ncbi:acyl-CoA dehydrogenase family protein [Amycolatopsis sp. H6(2020)]|nr:acyl-CoA dehydrogenase family protein [Amycolatopsis sp. H6(2020)]
MSTLAGNHRPPGTETGRALAERFEAEFGDPFSPAAPVTFEELLRSDERAEAPRVLMDRLAGWGFGGYLVPRPYGGRLRDFESLLWLCRCLARRDMRGALGHGTSLLGANPVWLWGSGEQRRIVAAKLLRNEFGSFAMSEKEHGSDLGSYEVTATGTAAGIVLDGQKWPIGNATRGTFATVYARSRDSRLYSLVLVDKDAVPPEQRENEPLATTLGLRGHDLSGFRFAACLVPAEMRIGREGSGTAKALKSLQITRVLISSMSLGSLDTALRTTLRHCRNRRLYGTTVDRIPAVTAALVTAYLDLLVAECVATPVSRSISVCPTRLSLWSSVVKYLVPTTVDTAIAELARVYSARGYIRADEQAAVFQKVQRDHLAAGIFEGTSHVNLANVAAQLPTLVPEADPAAAQELLDTLFARDREPRPWDPAGTRLELTNGGRDEISAAWPRLTAAVRADGLPGGPRYTEAAVAALDRLDGIRQRVLAESRALRAAPATSRTSTRNLLLAQAHCLLHAAACCLLTWQANRGRTPDGAPLAEPWWVALSLQRIVQRLDPLFEPAPDLVEEAMGQLTAQFAGNRLFSLENIGLGSP